MFDSPSPCRLRLTTNTEILLRAAAENTRWWNNKRLALSNPPQTPNVSSSLLSDSHYTEGCRPSAQRSSEWSRTCSIARFRLFIFLCRCPFLSQITLCFDGYFNTEVCRRRVQLGRPLRGPRPAQQCRWMVFACHPSSPLVSIPRSPR